MDSPSKSSAALKFKVSNPNLGQDTSTGNPPRRILATKKRKTGEQKERKSQDAENLPNPRKKLRQGLVVETAAKFPPLTSSRPKSQPHTPAVSSQVILPTTSFTEIPFETSAASLSNESQQTIHGENPLQILAASAQVDPSSSPRKDVTSESTPPLLLTNTPHVFSPPPTVASQSSADAAEEKFDAETVFQTLSNIFDDAKNSPDPVKSKVSGLLSRYIGPSKTAAQVQLEKQVEVLTQQLQNVTLDRNILEKRNEELKVSLHKRKMEIYKFESAAEEFRIEKESLTDQYNQLDNLHSYSVDHIENLSKENFQLHSQQNMLNNEISQLKYSLNTANIKIETLSDENEGLSKEKRYFLNDMAISSQQLTLLQNVCDRQKQDLYLLQNELKILEASSSAEKNSLKSELEGLRVSSIAEKNKFIQAKITLNDKVDHLKNQYTQLEASHTSLAKENKFLRSKEKKFQSRLKGVVGDKFDDEMNRWENSYLTIVQQLTSQKEESEKALLASLSSVEEKLSKVRKENALLATTLACSRDRHERRLDYTIHFKDVQDRNHQKELLRQVHLQAEVLVNNILLANSLPTVKVDPLKVEEDEVPRPIEDDYYYESGDETLDDEGNLRDRDGHVIAVADPGPQVNSDAAGGDDQNKDVEEPSLKDATQEEEKASDDKVVDEDQPNNEA